MGWWMKVIGIGEEGMDGMGKEERNDIEEEKEIFGGKRNMEFMGNEKEEERIEWN